jgi:hypothetical protein
VNDELRAQPRRIVAAIVRKQLTTGHAGNAQSLSDQAIEPGLGRDRWINMDRIGVAGQSEQQGYPVRTAELDDIIRCPIGQWCRRELADSEAAMAACHQHRSH